MTIAMYPGRFDPITNGHVDLIRRARPLFDELIVAVGHNPEKDQLFTPDERAETIGELIAEALEQDPEFFAFRRSLEAYGNFLKEGTTVVLSADSDLLQYLESPSAPSGEETP